MNDTMAIARSIEDGMYIFREGDCLWRVNADGIIDCTAQGHTIAFKLLTFIQQCRLSRGPLPIYGEDPAD